MNGYDIAILALIVWAVLAMRTMRRNRAEIRAHHLDLVECAKETKKQLDELRVGLHRHLQNTRKHLP